MTLDQPWHYYLMALLYVLAGMFHFIKPKIYLRIMPPYMPNPKSLVLLSGIAEMVLGIGLCFTSTKNLAIWGIIAMLAVFLPVHFYMLQGGKAGAGLPKWLLVLRLPLQIALMYWAYGYLE
jgi:uncharacterized membrane protein